MSDYLLDRLRKELGITEEEHERNLTEAKNANKTEETIAFLLLELVKKGVL